MGGGFADAGDGDDDFAWEVNLTALPTRLLTIWRRRPGIAPQMQRHFGPDEGGQFEALAVGLRGEQVHGVVDDFAQIEVDDVEVELAGLDLGEVEDVVDDDEERFAADADGAGELALLGSGRS
jgi:hypothetical protein